MKILALLFVSIFVVCCSSSEKGPLPQLSSPARATAWGSPTTTQTATGYQLKYTNPRNPRESLKIIGSKEMLAFFTYPPNIKGTQIVNGQPVKVDTPQTWNKSLMNGKTVFWYQARVESPAEPAFFRTRGIDLTNSAGQTGFYQIEVSGSKSQMQAWLSELQFTP